MAPVCLCEAVFGSITALRNHAILHGHFFRCDCSQIFHTKDALDHHHLQCVLKGCRRLVVDCPPGQTWRRSYCGVCPNKQFPFSSQRDCHLRLAHNACPSCHQTFSSRVERNEHQKADKHSYCVECDRSYATFGNLMKHIRSLAHNVYADESSEHQEVSSAAAVLLTFAEEMNLSCEACEKTCATLKGFRAHKDSSKHRDPFVSIKCACGKTFPLISSFVQHLESSTCISGVTREKLNATVYKYDSHDRSITMAEHAGLFGSTITSQPQSSIAPFDSASSLAHSLSRFSLNSRISEVDDEDLTFDGSVNPSTTIFTPNESEVSSGILTPRSGATASILSGGDLILPPTASVSVLTLTSSDSSDGGILTPPPSTTSGISTLSGSTSGTGNGFHTPSSGSVSKSFHAPPSSSIGVEDDISTSSTESDPRSTPSASMTGEWAFLNSSNRPTPNPTSVDGSSAPTIRANVNNSGLPLCTGCGRTFASLHALRQHIGSGVHGPKILHCPTGGALNSLESDTPDREFTTLSGLVQHVEHGNCNSGDGALMALAGLMQRSMGNKVGMTMQLLDGSAK
ncbi:hypothetical protein Q7P37_000392 [Cladosporium fusiforme]